MSCVLFARIRVPLPIQRPIRNPLPFKRVAFAETGKTSENRTIRRRSNNM
jgi:hypothetical protein